MTRSQLRTIINRAHELLHEGAVNMAHDVLHDAVGETESMTADPEVQAAAAAFFKAAEGVMPCGHTFGDLISAPGTITKCGACVAERTAAFPAPRTDTPDTSTAFARQDREDGWAWAERDMIEVGDYGFPDQRKCLAEYRKAKEAR